MRSSRTTSGFSRRNAPSAASPSATKEGSNPSPRSTIPSISASAGSSSTTSTRPLTRPSSSLVHRRTRTTISAAHVTMRAMSEPTPGWASPGGHDPASTPTAPPGPSADWQPAGGWTQPGWGQPGWGQPRPPEPKPGVVPLRPLGLGELLDGAVALIRRYPRPVLGLSAALAIISTALNVTLALTVFKPLIDFDISTFESGGTATTDEVDGFFGGALIGSLGSSLVTALATVILTGVVTVVVGRGVLGEPITLGEAWSVVRSALWRLVGLSLLVTLLVYGSLAVGVTLAVIFVAVLGGWGWLPALVLGAVGICLAVYLYCRLALAPCVLILERAGVRTSMRRSGVLVGGAWWRVCGILILAAIVAGVVANVIQ